MDCYSIHTTTHTTIWIVILKYSYIDVSNMSDVALLVASPADIGNARCLRHLERVKLTR